MNKPIIEIKNIGKKYNITHQKGGYVALRDVLAGILKNPFKFAKNKAKQIVNTKTKEEFWALRGIDVEIHKGDIVGIIGHNGAGKSTLLKILTGITPPTEGEIIMRGRVASLLEVGTGFHPELTGRENIFLNGAILGMTKKEIVKKFDEIVAFSGVEQFLDTPVKYYSSGMYVRLAFSVAAHMEPDILLVDEVLAVGDAEFQKKCLGKMEEVTKSEGRTILFVSHNMSAIQQLCSKTILIEKGKVKMFGETREVITMYLEALSKNMIIPLTNRKDRTGSGHITFEEIKIKGIAGSNTYGIGDDIYVHFKIKNSYPHDATVKLALNIRTTSTEELISCDSSLNGESYVLPASSTKNVVCKIYSPPLNIGNYYLNIGILHDDQFEDRIQSVAEFSISTGTFDNRVGTNSFPVLAKFNWEIE
ncbi:MAG: ABC transporter ATP-binding protein [bacterium]|nr:ABC transporter ATP-binding protein [bacterium]